MLDELRKLEQRVADDMRLLDKLAPAPALDTALSRSRESVRRALAQRRRATWALRLAPAGGIAAALAFIWLAVPLERGNNADLAAEETMLDDWAAAFHDSGEQLVRQWWGDTSPRSDDDSLEAELSDWGLSDDEEDSSGA